MATNEKEIKNIKQARADTKLYRNFHDLVACERIIALDQEIAERGSHRDLENEMARLSFNKGEVNLLATRLQSVAAVRVPLAPPEASHRGLGNRSVNTATGDMEDMGALPEWEVIDVKLLWQKFCVGFDNQAGLAISPDGNPEHGDPLGAWATAAWEKAGSLTSTEADQLVVALSHPTVVRDHLMRNAPPALIQYEINRYEIFENKLQTRLTKVKQLLVEAQTRQPYAGGKSTDAVIADLNPDVPAAQIVALQREQENLEALLKVSAAFRTCIKATVIGTKDNSAMTDVEFNATINPKSTAGKVLVRDKVVTADLQNRIDERDRIIAVYKTDHKITGPEKLNFKKEIEVIQSDVDREALQKLVESSQRNRPEALSTKVAQGLLSANDAHKGLENRQYAQAEMRNKLNNVAYDRIVPTIETTIDETNDSINDAKTSLTRAQSEITAMGEKDAAFQNQYPVFLIAQQARAAAKMQVTNDTATVNPKLNPDGVEAVKRMTTAAGRRAQEFARSADPSVVKKITDTMVLIGQTATTRIKAGEWIDRFTQTIKIQLGAQQAREISEKQAFIAQRAAAAARAVQEAQAPPVGIIEVVAQKEAMRDAAIATAKEIARELGDEKLANPIVANIKALFPPAAAMPATKDDIVTGITAIQTAKEKEVTNINAAETAVMKSYVAYVVKEVAEATVARQQVVDDAASARSVAQAALAAGDQAARLLNKPEHNKEINTNLQALFTQKNPAANPDIVINALKTLRESLFGGAIAAMTALDKLGVKFFELQPITFLHDPQLTATAVIAKANEWLSPYKTDTRPELKNLITHTMGLITPDIGTTEVVKDLVRAFTYVVCAKDNLRIEKAQVNIAEQAQQAMLQQRRLLSGAELTLTNRFALRAAAIEGAKAAAVQAGDPTLAEPIIAKLNALDDDLKPQDIIDICTQIKEESDDKIAALQAVEETAEKLYVAIWAQAGAQSKAQQEKTTHDAALAPKVVAEAGKVGEATAALLGSEDYNSDIKDELEKIAPADDEEVRPANPGAVTAPLTELSKKQDKAFITAMDKVTGKNLGRIPERGAVKAYHVEMKNVEINDISQGILKLEERKGVLQAGLDAATVTINEGKVTDRDGVIKAVQSAATQAVEEPGNAVRAANQALYDDNQSILYNRMSNAEKQIVRTPFYKIQEKFREQQDIIALQKERLQLAKKMDPNIPKDATTIPIGWKPKTPMINDLTKDRTEASFEYNADLDRPRSAAEILKPPMMIERKVQVGEKKVHLLNIYGFTVNPVTGIDHTPKEMEAIQAELIAYLNGKNFGKDGKQNLKLPDETIPIPAAKTREGEPPPTLTAPGKQIIVSNRTTYTTDGKPKFGLNIQAMDSVSKGKRDLGNDSKTGADLVEQEVEKFMLKKGYQLVKGVPSESRPGQQVDATSTTVRVSTGPDSPQPLRKSLK